MRDADLVFTIADTMRSEIIDRGIEDDKVIVIPNAVDPDSFRPQPRDESLADELGLRDRTVLGYVSNLGHREGIDILVRAIGVLRGQGHDVACLIVGEGPEMEPLVELVAELGLEGHVVLTGQVPHDRIRSYYSLIDLFVVPRRDDRAARLVTPLKPFEAMAMELPLLVADLPALEEIVAPGERGASFRSGDPESLAREAADLIAQPERLREFAVAGRAWVERERTWASNGQRYVDAYGRLGVRPVDS